MTRPGIEPRSPGPLARDKKKKILKAFQNIVAIFKINPIDFRFFLFYM